MKRIAIQIDSDETTCLTDDRFDRRMKIWRLLFGGKMERK